MTNKESYNLGFEDGRANDYYNAFEVDSEDWECYEVGFDAGLES